MADLRVPSSEDEPDQPPGTFKLIRVDETGEHGHHVIALDPIPSSDPNEPLNWSTLRKSVNFTIVSAMTIIIFTSLETQSIFWQQMIPDMGVSYTQLNQAMSVNFVGLATGCLFFIPFAKKYGRRPIYIISAALLLATTFWMARMDSLTELYITNLLQGLAGATNESIVEMTIADLYFVHHRGTMNGLYMSCVMIGSFLTPMAAGVQATRQGWRASYLTMGAFNIVLFFCFAFLYEETKYVPVLTAQTNDVEEDTPDSGKAQIKDIPVSYTLEEAQVTEATSSHHFLDHTIPLKSWRQRLALATPTPEPIWPNFYRPFEVLIFPAVAFAALQYASCVAWLTVLSSVMSLQFPLPPYSFSPEQIGYTSAGPLIGNIISAVYGGYLGDRSILYYARRNNGFYEPEMRLNILHIPAIMMAGGLVMFGATISRVSFDNPMWKSVVHANISVGDALDMAKYCRCLLRFRSR
ncbi:unnamed protein product [Penicillium salamii]|uniref:Major facilitator superfamily (MFS) profile domain-containing protein n=1 Tax=Penicillium salamii TaxID=1612424 RepID=A0A9W4N3D4_9EURO|nr:unnamed protein product [Penicillium salamii]CAG7989105.1 unnamed protein product [Penicillium salamii]CAG8000129.1 unnamed protein product [Penicillium salamii]CAG8077966.1 unnamed protein product [Penicillium salamii]CAG8249927.1 unnamed protein product [Penicillium salamii]